MFTGKINSISILAVCVVLMVFCGCRKTETQQDIPVSFDTLSNRGHILCRKGNYIDGLKLLQEANDILVEMPHDSINHDEAVILRGNLANLYVRIGLFDEAKKLIGEAITVAEAENLPRLPELWGMRANIYEHSNHPDSQFICLRRNIELCENIKDSILREKYEEKATERLLWFYVENPNFAPDSIPMALGALKRINIKKATRLERIDGFATNQFLIGRAYVILEDYKSGLPIMEKALELFRERGDTESVEWGLQLLAQSYAAAGDCRLLDIYTEAADMHDTIVQRQSNDLLLGMDFKYRTSQLKNEKLSLQNEVRTKRQRIVYITIIFVLIVTAMLVFVIMYNRNNKRQIRLKQQNIDTLLAERIALNARIEELNQGLADSNTETLRRQVLQTILLEKEDESRFRKSFNDLYPGFIDRLRYEYPGLTAGNELLCMLIALNRRNDEIALALGISKESVTTSRYRLRSRFNLSKDTDLNDFIKSRLKP